MNAFVSTTVIGAVISTVGAALPAFGADVPAPAVSPATVPTASAASMPDWSGTWSLTEESRDRSVGGGGKVRTLLTPKYAALVPGPPPGGALPAAASLPGVASALRLNNNLTHCIPPGFPGDLTHPYAHEYLFTPGRVTMLIEDGEVRRIHTDGRSHLPAEQLYDRLVGDSIGHWDGSTLVVDTIGMRLEAELGAGIHPTRDTHVIERIHLKAPDLLEIDTEILDPAIFKEPYRYTMLFNRVAGDLIENDCELDQRDNDQSIDLTPPP